MATLILSTAGHFIGGQIGSTIGAIAGQYIDQTILFAPKARHGPRLGDLSIQTSSYGSAMPRLFGTMRVAGTVIWATDLEEHRSSAGTEAPRTIISYSSSFAVAISARAILGVQRIWADGKLLRGTAGDFKSETGFRLHLGDEDQAADPLIAAAEGGALAPAYRGLAYAMFEEMQLADFGNRIPCNSKLSRCRPFARAIAETLVSGAWSRAIPGADGYSRAATACARDRGAGRGVPLALVYACRPAAAPPGPAPHRTARKSGTASGAARAGRFRARSSSFSSRRESDVLHARSGRGWADRRTARSSGGVSAGAAKALAEYRLASLWSGRASATVALGWRRAGLRPGDRLALEGEAGIWRVTRRTLGPMTITLELIRASVTALPALAASPGRPVSEADLLHGPTVLRLHDLPLGDGVGVRPVIVALAGGSEAGWRRATLSASFDDGASWRAAGPTAAPATLGHALDALGDGSSALIDLARTVDVQLIGAGWLESRDDLALANGDNLALLGQELIQFGAAEPLGEGRFRLSRLLRGRRGTEWAAALHETEEPFALIDPDMVAATKPVHGTPRGRSRALANGIGETRRSGSGLTIEGGVAAAEPAI